jgi:superfamily II DNA/RNA helicase/HKD family nuclease
MRMTSDLTFITNEEGKTLLDRFKILIKDTRLFDVLVGYFYASGFHALYKSLEKTEKIRILVGISTSKQVVDMVAQAKAAQQELQFSHAEAKEFIQVKIQDEMEKSADRPEVEEGIRKFIEWIISKKLEIRAYPSQNIHAKIYIMTFAEGDRDVGRVITGSSNFTQAGLVDNLELNVELKARADYDFSIDKFNSLWKDSVDISEDYVETIKKKTWLNDDITPYELYLKLLYEYFRDDLSQSEELFARYFPVDFKKYEYQEQAVFNAKRILDEYGGVFISDVVGLGKTYVSAMLAGQLEGRTLIIAPPVLLDDNNPGSWPNVFRDFNIPATFKSIGKLEDITREDMDQYKNVIVDEAHRFRTETNVTYENLAQICRGKRVILVTATPYNNAPKDILSQIKLFQNVKRSTLPNLPNLEEFFNHLQRRLKDLDRKEDYNEYIRITKENAKEIREKVLKYLMIRRTRGEIVKYFSKDLKEQNLKFPEPADPEPIYYQLNKEEERIFDRTIELLTSELKYARYTPLLPIYYDGKITQPEKLSQQNMGIFMKILLIKRLESSIYAFRNSIERFIHTYERVLKELEDGAVYISKKYSNKIYELLENDDDEAVQLLIDEGKVDKYAKEDFSARFKDDLEHDLAILKSIKKDWAGLTRDPKLESFAKELKKDKLRKNKLVIFTESRETAEYLWKNLGKLLKENILVIHGSSGAHVRREVIDNFDAKVRAPKDDYRILIATEVLSEGVNLHRANTVINYDIPWNPTRLMQRVGRINRVDTKFDKIFTYNCFPTSQSNDEIKLRELAEAKIHAFIALLGSDARLLTEGEPIESHELFNRLTSKQTITGEDDDVESELEYLNVIKQIRDDDTELFDKIKRLNRKARTARLAKDGKEGMLTYFKKGKLQKFYLCKAVAESEELDFMAAAKLLESLPSDKKELVPPNYYIMLDNNKKSFELDTIEDMPDINTKGGRDSSTQVLRIVRAIMNYKGFTEDQEEYIKRVIKQLVEGGLPKQTTKTLLAELNSEMENGVNELRFLAVIQKNLPDALLKEHFSQSSAKTTGPREVILSECLIKANG